MTPWDGISRRQLLSSAAAVGALGAITGVGTAAYLADGERMQALLEGGRLDLAVTCRGDATCTQEGDSVRFGIGEVTPGDCGSVEICLAVSDNPAWLWLRADCPSEDVAPVANYLHAQVTYADGAPVAGTPTNGSLADVLAALATGVQIDANRGTNTIDPFQPGQNEVCLTLSWAAAVPSVADEAAVSYDCADAITLADLQAGEQLDFDLAFFASQYRHSELGAASDEGVSSAESSGSRGATPANPWPDAVACDDPLREVCLDCRFLGKYELDDDGQLVVGEAYPLLDGDEQPTGYALLVQGTRDKGDETDTETSALTEFTLIETGSEAAPVLGPTVCQVVIGAGPAGSTDSGGGSRDSSEGGSKENDDGGSPNPIDTAVVCPPAAHVTADLDAGDYAISNVSVYVCDPGTLPDCGTTEETQ